MRTKVRRALKNFSQGLKGKSLIEIRLNKKDVFLATECITSNLCHYLGVSTRGPGVHGKPHLHDDPMPTPMKVVSGSDFRFEILDSRYKSSTISSQDN